jgi:hypothetical protein
MNLAALILVTLLGGISIYDFYVLKKAKVKTLTCLSSAGITLVVNVVLFIIGLMIGSAIFGEDNNVYLIVSVILVAGVSYFRFTGREIKVVKKKTKTVKDKKSIKDKLKDDIENAASFGGLVAAVTFGLLFYLKQDNSIEYYMKFSDPILIGALAYWTYKKLSFWGCLLMTSLFIIGKLMLIIPAYAGGYGGAGIGMTVVMSYFMIKGVIAAYKYNSNK